MSSKSVIAQVEEVEDWEDTSYSAFLERSEESWDPDEGEFPSRVRPPTRAEKARQRRLLSGVPQKPPGAQQRTAAAEAKRAAAKVRQQRVETTLEKQREPKPSRYVPNGYVCLICRGGKGEEEEKGVPRKLRCRCRKEIVWHFGCINTWLSGTGKCPLCKEDVSPFTQP